MNETDELNDIVIENNDVCEDILSRFNAENKRILTTYKENITTNYKSGVKNYTKNVLKKTGTEATAWFKKTNVQLDTSYNIIKSEMKNAFEKIIEKPKTDRDDLIFKAKQECDETIEIAIARRDDIILNSNSIFKNEIKDNEKHYLNCVENTEKKHNHTKGLLNTGHKNTRASIKRPVLQCGEKASKKVCGKYYTFR